MPQPKRARPDFDPPRPKHKGNETVPKFKSKEQAKRKRSHPSKASAHNSRRISDTASNNNSASLISDEDEPSEAQSDTEPTNSDGGSPEPDYILAEVTHEPANDKDNVLSLPLLHRIMQEHFQDKEKMKITGDARELVGKYMEVFVREAIMRSAYERNERDKESGTAGASKGWLEVDDLERIAPQLCLDF